MTQLLNDRTPTGSAHIPSEQRTAKVLHIVNGEHYAGAARVQDLLALSLPEYGYSVSFACLLAGQFAGQRESHDAPLFNFPMKHRLDFSPVSEIAKFAASEGYGLLHSHTTRSAMIAAAAAQMCGLPHVHHVHCQMDTEIGSRVKRFVNKSIERLAANRADRVIAVSGSIQTFLARNGFDRSRICTIPNGVPAPQRVRPRRHVTDGWTIGMVALLRQRKGLETLLRAFRKLSRHFNVRLRVVGPFESEPYRRSVIELSEKLGLTSLVDWIPFTRDVNREIAGMDVVVLPSILPEGMPMVLLEAMSTGVPVVGSNVDGIHDVIRHEQNGLLAEVGSVESLATQLRRILSGNVSWDELRTESLREFQLKYSDSAMASAVAGVYDQILMAPR